MSGNLFLIVAPSGAGKSTLLKALLEREASLHLSISYTTRLPRSSEVSGKDYFFINCSEFSKLRNEGKMLESAEVHGNFYGTPRDWVLEQLSQGKDIVLEIDWQGACQVKKTFRDAIQIFILPPSLSVLEERLRKRAQDSEESIVQRLHEASRELGHLMDADYVVVNLEFQNAIADLQCIIAASRLRLVSQRKNNKDLFDKLGVLSYLRPEFF